jgi:hypothetical protein
MFKCRNYTLTEIISSAHSPQYTVTTCRLLRSFFIALFILISIYKVLQFRDYWRIPHSGPLSPSL